MVALFTPSHLGRYKDLAWLFFKYGRSELVDAAGLEMPGVRGKRGRLGNGRGKEHVPPEARELADDLEKMGPVYVKIGQMLSTRPDVLPQAFAEALERLQDKVEPFPFEEVEKIIKEELGTRMSRAFREFEPTPISAASLGQVHKAVLRDGRTVAVKVQRPEIREKMVEDLDTLAEVAEFLDKHTEMGKKYEFERLLGEFRRTLLHELDYREEAQNLKVLGRNMAEFKRLVVPQPIDDYTTSRVLTMEYIGGAKITALSPVVRTEIDGIALAEELFRAYLKQILVDGFFHADPHPGNILLTHDTRVALIDLGMVGRLTPSLQETLLKVLLAISEGRGEDAARQMISVSDKKEGFDEKEFTRQVADLVGRNTTMTVQQVAIGRMVLAIHRLAAEYGIRSPSETATLGKTLLNLDEVGSALNPAFQPNESIRQNATSLLQRRMSSSFTPGSIYAGILEAKGLLQSLPGKIDKILANVANNEIKIEVDAIDETKLMAGFQKVANRITAGLVMAALIIGAALLMRIDTPWRILGYPALAMIFFMLAAAGGIILVVHALFYDEPSNGKGK